jgi:anti-sigma factor RsiW
MISCADFMAELSAYVEGDVAADVRRQLERHLAHCQTCQVIFDSTRKTLRIVTDSGCFDFPEETSKPVVSQVMAKLRARRE